MKEPNEFKVLEHMRALGVPDASVGALWVRVTRPGLPASGWKLHVSATPGSYATMLRAALPVLVDTSLSFKAAASAEVVEGLNDGRYGLTQVGKVLTVYPANDDIARTLGNRLSQCLRGIEGPPVSTDAGAWSADAPVYFRYGAFDGTYRVDALGRKVRRMTLPDGTVTDDTTDHSLEVPRPPGFPDATPPDSLAFLRDRYLFVQILHLSAKGAVVAAVERARPDAGVQIIKTARRHAQADTLGRDAHWALQREADAIAAVGESAGIAGPAALVASSDGTTKALVRPMIAAEPFAVSWQTPDARSARRRSDHAVLLRDLEERVRRIHEHGWLVRDLSPSNGLDDEGAARIVDLELAQPIDSGEPAYRRGTLGFYDADRPRHAAASRDDDHYALDAWKRMLDTGAYPEWPLDERPSLPGGAMRAYLHTWCTETPHGWIALDRANVFGGLAGVMSSACVWAPRAVAEVLEPAEVRTQAARRLASAARELRHIPGYYFGAAGIGAAMLRIGRLVQDKAWREHGHGLLTGHAWERSDVPDLCHGVAGTVWALLDAHRLAPDDGYLDRAAAAGERLASMAEPTDDGRCWPWPDGPHAGLSGERQYGFAHGTAGVVSALCALQALSPSNARADAIAGGIRFLLSGARALEGDACWWPVSETDERCWNAWSHGTPGVVKALAAASPYSSEAVGALSSAVRGIGLANNTGYCLCHGIASRLDAYLDALPLLAESDAEAHAEALAQASADAEILARMPAHRYEARVNPEAGDDGYGWLKGAAGVWWVLARWKSRPAHAHD